MSMQIAMRLYCFFVTQAEGSWQQRHIATLLVCSSGWAAAVWSEKRSRLVGPRVKPPVISQADHGLDVGISLGHC